MTQKFIVTYRPPEHAGRLIAVEHDSAQAVLDALLPATVAALEADNGPFELFGQRFDVEALMVRAPDDAVRLTERSRRPAPVRYQDSRGLVRRYVAPEVEALDDWFARMAKQRAVRGSLDAEYAEFLRAEA